MCIFESFVYIKKVSAFTMNQHNRLAVKEKHIYIKTVEQDLLSPLVWNIPFFFQKYFVLLDKTKVRTLKENNYKGKVDKSTD